MKPLSIRARLDTWYSLAHCQVGSNPKGTQGKCEDYSIRVTVDAGLQQHLEGVCAILAEDTPKGLAALKDELQEYYDGVGTLGGVRVADTSG